MFNNISLVFLFILSLAVSYALLLIAAIFMIPIAFISAFFMKPEDFEKEIKLYSKEAYKAITGFVIHKD